MTCAGSLCSHAAACRACLAPAVGPLGAAACWLNGRWPGVSLILNAAGRMRKAGVLRSQTCMQGCSDRLTLQVLIWKANMLGEYVQLGSLKGGSLADVHAGAGEE